MANRQQELMNYANDIGVRVIHAKTSADSNLVAIHLLNPDLRAFEDALHTAEKDLFPAIVIHSNKTWLRS